MMTTLPPRRLLMTALPLVILSTALFSSTPPAVAGATGDTPLTFLDIVPARDSAGDPGQLRWGPSGNRLAFVRNDGDGPAAWLLEVSKKGRGDGPALLVRATDLDAEAKAIGGVHWSPDGDSLLLEAAGDLFLVAAGSGKVKRLTTTDAEETGPSFSPTGDSLVFVRDADLHLLDLSSGKERALTTDGEEGVTLNGINDWVYWEEIWGRSATGFWWNPEGTHIAYYRFDETPVPTYALVNFQERYPEVKPQKYPKAGQANPVVKIGVLDVASGKTVWMQTTGDGDDYLARVHWVPGGKRLAIQRLNREQDRLDLLACDPAAGACNSLLTEEWPTWVNLGNDFAFLADGRFIWGSEGSGWRRLYLHGPDGKRLRQLTPDEWAVTSLDAIDEKRGRITFTGFETRPWGATERQVLRVSLDGGGKPEPLTSRAGWNTTSPAPESGLWVHTWSDADTPPVRQIRGSGIAPPITLPAAARGYDPAALPRWEFLTIDGPGGARLPARILLPPRVATGSSPGSGPQRRPVIMYHYGGPASQVVVNRWSGRGRGLWHKMMARQGYVIFSVDNEGSAFFGKKGEDRMHRRFGEINLAAQIAAVDYLRSRDDVDAERIGLWGWSGGGANTLYCILNRPGVWKAGVSGAPVTDWHLYDTIWTERYMDHPDDNPDGYAASSSATYAANLKDSLLIVHGTADDNVHPQNTLIMIQKLVEAGVPFEDAIYPRQKHGFRYDSARHFYQRMTRFFERELGE